MRTGFIIILVATLMSFASCSRTVYVPVESTKTEYRDVLRRDSIHLYDSIHVKEKGDTVLIERYKQLFVDRFVRDSVFICDTVRIPYPVVEVKEKVVYKTKWYEDVLIYLGIGMLLFFIVSTVKKKFFG